MTISSDLLNLLCCPLHGEELQLTKLETLDTANSNSSYPIIQNIPWLISNPQNSLIDWSIKLNHFHQILDGEIQELESEIIISDGATRKRLERLYKAKQSFLRSIFELMSPVVRNEMAQKNTYDTLTDIAPNTQNLLSYESNLYRDWVWGEEENKKCLDIVEAHIDKKNASKILILGAGAGRLALDIHQAILPKISVATDINPLMVLAAQKILHGDGLSIYEFPEQPITSEDVAVEHHITSCNAPDNFHYVFSDANKPAFIKGSFDTVITPWLIDIQPLELSLFLKQLNQYINLGAQWINFGSLVFNQNRDALCYSIDEIKIIALAQGFEISDVSQDQIPYLKSPYNSGHRIETVWSWRAKKIADVQAIKDTQYLPSWVLDTSLPVPKESYFKDFSLNHRIYAQMGAEVDGRTSIKKIGNKLAKQLSMDNEESTKLIRNVFIDLFSQNRH